MSPSIAYGWIWNTIPNLAIWFPKMVQVGSSRTSLPCVSHKHIGASQFKDLQSPESFTEVSGSFPESPTDSQALLCMISLLFHILYKYEALASKISSHSLIIFTAFKPRHLIICEPCTNLSISLNSLCDTLISIICAKIASHSHGLSSYWTLVG